MTRFDKHSIAFGSHGPSDCLGFAALYRKGDATHFVEAALRTGSKPIHTMPVTGRCAADFCPSPGGSAALIRSNQRVAERRRPPSDRPSSWCRLCLLRAASPERPNLAVVVRQAVDPLKRLFAVLADDSRGDHRCVLFCSTSPNVRSGSELRANFSGFRSSGTRLEIRY